MKDDASPPPAERSPPPPSLWESISGDGTPRKAFATAIVVGALLTAINHGDIILAGGFPPPLKFVLNFCVPYCVATWGAVAGKRAQWRRQQREGG